MAHNEKKNFFAKGSFINQKHFIFLIEFLDGRFISFFCFSLISTLFCFLVTNIKERNQFYLIIIAFDYSFYGIRLFNLL